MRSHTDIEFAVTPQKPLHLDIHVPDGGGPFPAVFWICGGGWKQMNKAGATKLATWVAEHGFAVVAFNYRITSEAGWPAQIQDCKAAVRWARAHAADYSLDADRFAAWGDSAGGHLAAMLGTTGNVAKFEIGEHLGQSSAVSAACCLYPPTDFPRWGPDRNAEVEALLGGRVDEVPEVAIEASPVTYIDRTTPPHLLIHGDADRVVPVEQSYLFKQAMDTAGRECELMILPRVGHDSDRVYPDENVRSRTLDFFREHLKAQAGSASRKVE